MPILILLLCLHSLKIALIPFLSAVLVGSSIFLIHNYSVIENPITSFFGEEVQVRGKASADSALIPEKVVGSRKLPSRGTFLMRAEEVSDGSSILRIRAPIRVFIDSNVSIYPGQEIRITGEIFQSNERGVSANLTAKNENLVIGNAPRILKALEVVRVGLRNQAANIGGDSASLLPGIIIGDTTLQSRQFTDQMRSAGLSHLTAVSGANFAIVGTFVYLLLGYFIPNRRVRIPVTLISLIFFILLVRPSPSVLRAAVMTGIYFLSRFSGRKSDSEQSLAVAISILLLVNPFLAFEAGFILSVLATAGLIYLAEPIAERINAPKMVRELISIPIAATLACSPYLALLTGSINLGIVILNIAVAPIIPVITILTFLATLTVSIFPSISLLLLNVANLGSHWVVLVSSLEVKFPTLGVGPIYLIALLGLVIINLKRNLISKKVKKALIIFLIIFFMSGSLQGALFPGKNWLVGQCDVGQGDALLIRVAKDSAILFDAGPDPKLLKKCLDQFGINYLPLVVISHEHADHYQGLTGIGNIGEIWTNHKFSNELKIVSREVKAGTLAKIGNVQLEVIWPKNGSEVFESLSGDGSLENNRSLVILASVEDVQILITGDIEPAAQMEILKEVSEIDLEIVKVPHHGSRYQIDELFQSAELFLVSVGKNNYGHPNPELLGRLRELGTVHRTDKSGPVAIAFKERESHPVFSLRRLRKDWWRFSWQ